MSEEKNDAISELAAAAQEIIPAIEKQVFENLPKAFRELPLDVRKDVLAKISGATVSISHSTWNGDYPPPSVLEGYEAIHEGLANRIVQMAEDDLAHSHSMEKAIASYMTRGQWFGFILAVIAIVGSISLIYSGTQIAQIAGSVLGASVIIPLVGMFVRGQIGTGPAASGGKAAPSAPKKSLPPKSGSKGKGGKRGS